MSNAQQTSTLFDQLLSELTSYNEARQSWDEHIANADVYHECYRCYEAKAIQRATNDLQVALDAYIDARVTMLLEARGNTIPGAPTTPLDNQPSH